MNARASAPSRARELPTPFQLPRDRQAWAPFLASSVGGWLALSHGERPSPEAALLAVAMLALFLASEWLSNLSGRGREGLVAPARAGEPAGLALLALLALSLCTFLVRLERPLRQDWGVALTAVACLVALLFLLRREWVPLDRRLLALTHFILTLPSLLFAFAHWGVAAPQAFKLWLLPALFFPSLALIGYAWMEGDHGERSAPTLAVAPLLGAVVAAAWQGAWPLAALLAGWALRAVWLLDKRQLSGRQLPPMRDIQRYGWESEAWATAVTLLWLAHVWSLS